MNIENELNKPVDFLIFMRVLRYFPAEFIYQGGYTNDDYQMYIIDQGETLSIEDYYEAYDETEEGTFKEINESKARRVTVPMPKTLKEAIDLVPVIFNDPDWKDEDREETISDYLDEVQQVKGIEFRKRFFSFPPDSTR